jgi:protein subunit release factor B
VIQWCRRSRRIRKVEDGAVEAEEEEESRRRRSEREKKQSRRLRQICVLVEQEADDSRGSMTSHSGTLERKNEDGALEDFLTSFGAPLPFTPGWADPLLCVLFKAAEHDVD